MYKRILLAVMTVALVVVGVLGYMYLRPTEEASQPIEAIPVVVETSTLPAVESEALAGTETGSIGAASQATGANAAAVTVSETQDLASDASEQASADPDSGASAQSSAPVVMEIIPDESEVRFIIDEVLNGAPKTVVGVTNQVAGQIAVYPDAVGDTQIGAIQINARTLTTDDSMRNRAIGNRILFTEQYEYITFTPTNVTGFPEAISIGEPISLQIEGDLTVKDVTLPVSFEAQVTAVSETRLEGSASTTIRYADFGISIPRVPSVTDVEDEVALEIDFVAEPV